MFGSEDYVPDSVASNQLLYTSDNVYAVVVATKNRLNNLLIRAKDEHTILADLCRIFRESKSISASLCTSFLTFFSRLVSVPTNSWLSEHSISSQLIAYRQSTSHIHNSSSDWDLELRRHVLPFWRRINQRNEVWLSMETVKTASSSMQAMKRLTEGIHATYALIRSTRYHILMSHCLAWFWLESICAYHSQLHIARDTLSLSWPCKLARYILIILETRLPTFTLRPSDYIPHLSSESQTFRTIGIKEYSIADCVPTLQQRVYLQMKRILQKWLDFPQDEMADSQAWVVQNFVGVFGLGSLLLDEVWDVYQHVPKHVLGRSRKQTRSIFLHQLIPFFHCIRSCEAAVKNSPARTLLDQYHVEYVMHGSCRGDESATTYSSSIEVATCSQELLVDGDGSACCSNKLVESSDDVDVAMALSPSIDVCSLFTCTRAFDSHTVFFILQDRFN